MKIQEITTEEMLALKAFKDLLKREIKAELLQELREQKEQKPQAQEIELKTDKQKQGYRLFVNEIKEIMEEKNKKSEDVVWALSDFINNELELETNAPNSKQIPENKQADFLAYLVKRFK